MLKKNYYFQVKYWLIFSLILILSMISVGGLTRITGSGLSITEWEVFGGILPPFTYEKWNEYFSLYKEIPQYKIINYNMSLGEFKIIFYWEYYHRLLGRVIGIFFLLPLIYFTIKKVFDKKDLIYFYSIFGLICFQGVIGWYMVKSGLVENVSVSHYRLSLHLLMAFIIIGLIFWSFLNLIHKKNLFIEPLNKKNLKIDFFIILIFLQIFFGALVSGLDAGMIYQTWPLMNENYYPNDIIFKDLINFDNRSSVQFIHRNVAYFLFFYTILLGVFIFKKNLKLINFYFIVFAFILLQIILGILTLVSGLNNYIALLHQLIGVGLFLSTILLRFKLTL